MAKVLITGASGFIGSHLAEALVARGDEVTCLVRNSSQVDRLRALGATLVCGDVTDAGSLPAAIAGQETVFHLAGVTRPSGLNTYQVNEQGARNVARACAENRDPPVLVLVSSQAAAGPARGGRPLTEKDVPRPICGYGRSKLAAEEAVRQFAGEVPITIARPSGVFGPGDIEFLSMFRAVARFGVFAAPVWPALGVSLIHVADLARLLVLAAEKGTRIRPVSDEAASRAEGVYFAVSVENHYAADVARMMGEAVGRRRVFTVPVPSQLIWAVAAASEAVGFVFRRSPPLTLDRARQGGAGLWYCSAQAARDELGFSEAAPLLERFRQTADWYRKTGWL